MTVTESLKCSFTWVTLCDALLLYFCVLAEEALQSALRSMADLLRDRIASAEVQDLVPRGSRLDFLNMYDIVAKIKSDLSADGVNVADTCFNGQTVCDNPDNFFYFDALHPTSRVSESMARDINRDLNRVIELREAANHAVALHVQLYALGTAIFALIFLLQ